MRWPRCASWAAGARAGVGGGFDDLPVATDLTPGLTTVRLALSDIGAQAMRLLLDDEPGGRTVPAAAQLVVRESTARAAGVH
ncbi:substrate-binding domain-containing protein [Catellatospora bangladeshensis]|uniref:substrate-binding domain-containing protein n=1 Tax=Catellatospora bangladeshensis TaxID=310355 RepID=UPI003607C8E6